MYKLRLLNLLKTTTRWHSTSGKPLTISEVRENFLKKIVGTTSEYGASQPSEPLEGSRARTSQEELPDRRMKDSYREAIIPLQQDPIVRDRYITFKKGVRLGRILEDLDTFAGYICYTHFHDPDLDTKKKSPISIVTALVDRIELHNPVVNPEQDLKMTGHMSWAGRSSMEVTMDIEQEIMNSRQKILRATFMMVARDTETKKAAVINRLVPDGLEETAMFKKGEDSKLLRQKEAMKALLKEPPSQEESVIIYNLFRNTIDEHSGTFKVRVKPPGTEWMENAKLKNVIMCHPEQRNIHNKVFGGFLMRQAMELAWTNVAIYSRRRPVLCVVDDIIFKRPVEIGSLLMMSSQVVYIDKSKMQVKVHAEVLDIDTGTRETTNDFHFTFDSFDDNLVKVIPKSYAESMLYLDGKRHYES